MQKIKLTDGTFIENVIDINNWENKDGFGRAVLNITVANTSYAEVIEKFRNNSNLFENIEIYSNVIGLDEKGQKIIAEEYHLEGNHLSFTEYNGIHKALPDGTTFKVQMIQDTLVSQLQATVNLQANVIVKQQTEIEEHKALINTQQEQIISTQIAMDDFLTNVLPAIML